MLELVVVVAGMASMAVEMTASRLLAPFFGTSLYIWAILIGLVLIYLTLGYWGGGRLADRRPSRQLFLALTALAGVAIGIVTFAAVPVLGAVLSGTEQLPFGLFWGAIAGCLALFAVPVVMLGTVNPFAIRLLVGRVADSGQVAGRVFALTTIGSLIGTFSAVFLLIPSIGTKATLLSFAGTLLIVSLLALAVASGSTKAASQAS